MQGGTPFFPMQFIVEPFSFPMPASSTLVAEDYLHCVLLQAPLSREDEKEARLLPCPKNKYSSTNVGCRLSVVSCRFSVDSCRFSVVGCHNLKSQISNLKSQILTLPHRLPAPRFAEQALARGFAQIDNLSSGQLHLRGDLRILHWQLVPHGSQLLRRHVHRCGDLPETGNL